MPPRLSRSPPELSSSAPTTGSAPNSTRSLNRRGPGDPGPLEDCLGGLAERDQLRSLREALQGALLDLTRPLGAHTELAAGLRQGLRLEVAGAEAHLDHVTLGLGELGDGGQERLGLQRLVDFLVHGRRLDRQQVAEGGVAVVAHGLVEADHSAVGLANLDDVLQRQVRSRGDLLVGRLVAELRRELALDAPDLAGALRNVHGKADGTARVLESALDRLTDPERRVRRETEALAPVELLDRADQPQHPFLDQVTEGEALALIAARVRDHQAEVGVDHAFLGCQIPALDSLSELDLLTRLEQRVPASLTQEQLERVESRIDLVLGLGAAAWGVGDGARFGVLRSKSQVLLIQ